jgi:hypothetical protein
MAKLLNAQDRRGVIAQLNGSLSLAALIVFVLVCGAHRSACQTSSTEPPRDPDAVAVVQAALTALGGASSWNELHGAVVTGTVAQADGSNSATFSWADDWSEKTRMRRESNFSDSGKHRVYLQDSTANKQNSSPSTSSTTGTPPPRPNFDSVPALLAHLPGAALSLALNNPIYSITMVASSSVGAPNQGPLSAASSSLSCVKIRNTLPKAPLDVDQVAVCFSTQTSLPVRADILLPNLLQPSHPLREAIQYGGFQSSGGVLVPSLLTITSPPKRVKTITIANFTWNPAFSAITFSGVSQ